MTDSPDALLRKNLAALRRTQPALVERIEWPCGSEHVAWTGDGGALLAVHRDWHRLDLTETEAQDTTAHLPASLTEPVLLFGLGLGETLQAALHRFAHAPLTAWERDPWLLRQTLSRMDLERPLRDGRLRLLLTSDLLTRTALTPPTVVWHPLLTGLYREERTWLEGGGAGPRALLATGGLIVEDVGDALRDLGWTVVPLELTRWSKEELRRVGGGCDARVSFAVNHTHGFAELCAELAIPLCEWEIDPSTDVLPPVPGGRDGAVARNTHVFTWRKAHVAVFLDAGYAHVEHLPLAANPTRRRPLDLTPEQHAVVDCDVAFVGSSLVEQGLQFRRRLSDCYIAWRGGERHAAEEEIETIVAGVLDAQRADLRRFRVPELLEAAAPEFVAAAAVGGGVFSELRGAAPAALLAEMAAADKRILYLANLGQVAAKVWGDAGWRHAEAYGAEWMGPAGHREALSRIYNGPGVHVDIGRLYQDDIVTMRVFDVLACGGFCLAEWSEGLDELFVLGEELCVHRSLDDLLQQVERWMEAGPAARRVVAERGRARVLRDHTVLQRVQSMLERASTSRPGAA